LQSERANWVPQKCVVIAGLLGSGKTTAALILSQMYSIPVVSAGDVFRKIAESQGLKTSRDTLQRLGAQFLKERGEVGLGNHLIQSAYPENNVIFEGIRPPETVLFIKRRVAYSLTLFLETNEAKRNARISERSGFSKEVQQADSKQIPLEEQALGIRSFADYVIDNSGTIEELKASLASAVADFF
jgi:dephospho-CoA kinase